MKLISKYNLLIIVVWGALFTSCDNELNNIIPAGTPRLEDHINKFKDFMIASANNGEIWISPVQLEQTIVNPLTSEDTKYPYFFGIQLKDKEMSNVFVSTRHGNQTSSEDSPLVKNNRTSYEVGGLGKIELKFLDYGILPELKGLGMLDFEFKVSSYNKDSIVLYSYFTLTNTTMKPYNFNDMKELFKASEQMQYYKPDNFLASPQNFGDTGIKISKGIDILYDYKKGENSDFINFDKRLMQYLDEENKIIVYKFIQELGLPLFTDLGITLLKPIESDFLNRRIVFDGYNNDDVKLKDSYRIEINYDIEDGGFDFFF